RQRQELFYLPDLSEMEVQVVLNESIVDRVRPGMRAAVRFEALPKLVLEGVVVSVGQIPKRERVESDNQRGEETDVRFYVSVVKLDAVAPGLKPGMTTRVHIALSPRENVLAIPHQAVKSDHGKKVCFVAHDESLERREVRIGHETIDLVEVTSGLVEGELVALNPPVPLTHVEPLFNFDQVDPLATADGDTVAAAQR
ncbi:MAG: efflux RND transporter periplasmic adaptor subunit, partial [Isosphaerales bacterium]